MEYTLNEGCWGMYVPTIRRVTLLHAPNIRHSGLTFPDLAL